ncbi:MAG: RluA family pseudouridine synthase [Opitutales bacterium]
MSEDFEYTVPPGMAGRADKILAAAFGDLSRSRIQKVFDAGLVFREDVPLVRKARVEPGDVLSGRWLPAPELDLTPAAIPLAVLFEDQYLIAVDKPAGMVTHPGSGTGPDTLVHALLHHCGHALQAPGGPERPGIVHRLDRETSGVIVVAKTDAAYHGLVEQFSARSLHKRYLAMVTGIPARPEGRIEAPIARHPTARTRMAVVNTGKPAITEYRVETVYPGADAARLACRILTGRTHQIRVHCSHLGHPLIGDTIYGYKPGRPGRPAAPRILLHAHRLALRHPVTGAPLELEAPEPADLAAWCRAVGQG